MKRFVLMLLLTTIMGGLLAQECTLRLQMPDGEIAPGQEFFVGLWIDTLIYPSGVPNLKSGVMGISFDGTILTPIKTGGPPPLQRYAWNMNPMFADYNCIPAEGYPGPGDLRFIIYGTTPGGMDPFLYGGMPFHIWDLKFIYNGGDIIISWQEENKSTIIDQGSTDVLKDKIYTYWMAGDGIIYNMTYVNIPSLLTQNKVTLEINNKFKIWSDNHKIYVQSSEINGIIVVYNMMGQKVISTKLEPGLNILPMSNKNAFYIVKVASANEVKSAKVFVK